MAHIWPSGLSGLLGTTTTTTIAAAAAAEPLDSRHALKLVPVDAELLRLLLELHHVAEALQREQLFF